MQVSFDHATAETATIWTYFFRPSQPLRYQAGQFIELRLPHAQPDSAGDKRWFTLSSAPTAPLLSITTKLGPQAGSSFKRALASLDADSPVFMSEPMGDFVLPQDPSRPLIFIAGGIGITPFYSMFQTLASQAEQRPINFFYGVKTESDIIFHDSFRAAHVPTAIFVAQPSPTWAGETGRLTADAIINLAKPSADSLLYIAGPEPMVEQLRDDLLAHGLGADQIVGDYFPGYK